MSKTTIYHNPRCGTSRTVLSMLRERGIEPEVIEYLKTPPDRATLLALAAANGEGVRGLLRSTEALADQLGLNGPGQPTDGELLDALAAHPVLLNRPIVVSPKGVRVCRPAERVLALLEPAAP